MNREKCKHFSRMEGEGVPCLFTEGVGAEAAETGLARLRSRTPGSTTYFGEDRRASADV
jgi:hypothetical protein